MPGERDGRLRVALIGCGAVGQRRAQVVARRAMGALIVAVDRAFDRARRVAEDTGCEANTDWSAAVRREDVDAVIVSTSHDMLAPIAIAAHAPRKARVDREADGPHRD
jgi:predicted dehydrogenase